MMTQSTRRSALVLMIGSGLAAGLTLPAYGQTPLAIPAATMKLSRRIERSLRDGKHVSVERTWNVDFARRGRGIAISGQQIDVTVDTPPALDRIAEIERERSTSDMWPILLSEAGEILAAGLATQEDDIAKAVQVAEQMIAQNGSPADVQRAQMMYLAQMQSAGASLLDQLPADLFYPVLGPVSTSREVDLPGGLTGQFEVTYAANAVPTSGWLERAERQVITRLGGSEQRARELWQMAAA